MSKTPFQIVYEFTGYRIKVWRVAKETEKTFMLIDDQSKYGTNTFRLNKRDLNKKAWYGKVFSFDFEFVKAAALERVEKEKQSLEKLKATIESSINEIEK